MPAKTEKQRKFMGAELQRKREGKKTRTDMTEKELEKYASKSDKKKNQAPSGGWRGHRRLGDLGLRLRHRTRIRALTHRPGRAVRLEGVDPDIALERRAHGRAGDDHAHDVRFGAEPEALTLLHRDPAALDGRASLLTR